MAADAGGRTVSSRRCRRRGRAPCVAERRQMGVQIRRVVRHHQHRRSVETIDEKTGLLVDRQAERPLHARHFSRVRSQSSAVRSRPATTDWVVDGGEHAEMADLLVGKQMILLRADPARHPCHPGWRARARPRHGRRTGCPCQAVSAARRSVSRGTTKLRVGCATGRLRQGDEAVQRARAVHRHDRDRRVPSGCRPVRAVRGVPRLSRGAQALFAARRLRALSRVWPFARIAAGPAASRPTAGPPRETAPPRPTV